MNHAKLATSYSKEFKEKIGDKVEAYVLEKIDYKQMSQWEDVYCTCKDEFLLSDLTKKEDEDELHYINEDEYAVLQANDAKFTDFAGMDTCKVIFKKLRSCHGFLDYATKEFYRLVECAIAQYPAKMSQKIFHVDEFFNIYCKKRGEEWELLKYDVTSADIHYLAFC